MNMDERQKRLAEMAFAAGVAESVAQSVFVGSQNLISDNIDVGYIAICEAAKSYNGPDEQFNFFARTVVRRRLCDSIKASMAKKRYAKIIAVEESSIVPNEMVYNDEGLYDLELEDLIQYIFARLRKNGCSEHMINIYRYHLDHKSNDEIARITGLAKSTVSLHIKHVREKIGDMGLQNEIDFSRSGFDARKKPMAEIEI